jgi:catalase (peroxidase I)
MAEYVNVKLNNGQDIVGVLDYEDDDIIRINNPIQIEIHPEYGLFAKSYMMLSTENTCVFYRAEVMYLSEANNKASEYYDQFVKKLTEQGEESIPYSSYSEEDVEDIEDMLTSIYEAKTSIKH